MWSIIPVLLFLSLADVPQIQAPAPSSGKSCETTELENFRYLLGAWKSADGPDIKVTPIFHSCAYEERWSGGQMGDAIAMRSWDPRTKRLYYTWVSPATTPQIWEGRKEENGAWRFYREWELNGVKMVSRIYWTQKATDRFVRVVEQSRDGGKTWRQHVLAEYQRTE